jgi:hypothetical protein
MAWRVILHFAQGTWLVGAGLGHYVQAIDDNYTCYQPQTRRECRDVACYVSTTITILIGSPAYIAGTPRQIIQLM